MRSSLALPFGLFLFATGYCAFTLSLETERMIGDAFGYDPGSRVMPLLAALILAVTAAIEMARARHREAPPAGKGGEAKLVLANIALAVLLIAAFRPAGFLPATCLVLYLLIALNLRSGGTPLTAGRILLGAVASLGCTVALYTVLRGVVRLCFLLARELPLALLREPVLQAVAVSLVVAVALVLAWRLLSRLPRLSDMVPPVLTAVGGTLAIYVVFRLLFLVRLPQGLLTW